MKYFRCCLLVLLSITFFLQHSSAAGRPDPTEQLKPFVERIVAQLKNPEFRKESVEQQILKIRKLASENFDFHEMSKKVVSRRWRHLTAEERDQFASLFAKLLGYVYIRQVDDYIHKEIKFVGQRFKGKDKAGVKTLFVDPNKQVSVSYAMILKAGKWMVYDVIAEGVSLVRNYHEQLKGEPRDQLIPKLKETINKAREKAEKIQTEIETKEQ